MKHCVVLLFLTCFALALHAQEQLLVLDEEGAPLPGVSVYTSDLDFAATTDLRGLASLAGWNKTDSLLLSFLGYQPLGLSPLELEELDFVVRLSPLPQNLEAVLVIGRRGALAGDVLSSVEILPMENLLFSQAQNVPDALEKESGLYVQKSQMGGGSPIMRGFEANRVLLVVDGVKMNNAIYRNGHLQNSLSIDAQLLDRIELIYGPGSLEYGSDALGGVLHFRTRSPKRREEGENTWQGRIYSRFSTANVERAVHLDVNAGFSSSAFLTSVSFSSYGDLRAGSRRPEMFPDFGKRLYYPVFRDGADYAQPNGRQLSDGSFRFTPNMQRPSGYNQFALGQKALWQLSDFFRLSANVQFSTTSDIPRYDQLALTLAAPDELRFAEWHYGPQQHLLLSLTADWSRKTLLFDRAQAILARQQLHEERIRRRFNRSLRTTQTEKVGVSSLTLDMSKALGPRHLLHYGLDVQLNEVRSTALGEDVQTGALFEEVPSRYAGGGSSLHRGGAYALYRWEPKSALFNVQAGLRYSLSALQARYTENPLIAWPDSYLNPGISNRTSGWSYGIGLRMPDLRGWTFSLSLATAFRAPNVDDVGKIRAKNGKITIPNPALQPERVTSGEFNLGYALPARPRTRLALSVFYSDLRDLMARRVYALPDGSSTIDVEGELLQTVANVNADRGFIYGLSANASLALGAHWSSGLSFTYTYGRLAFSKQYDSGPVAGVDTLLPLAHIPPPYGRWNLLYEGEKLKAEFVLRFNLAKKPEAYAVADMWYDDKGRPVFDRLGTSDNFEYTPAYTDENGLQQYAGSLAWYTLNFYVARSFGESLKLFLSLENVLDLHYRTFGSGISAAGFNSSIGISWEW